MSYPIISTNTKINPLTRAVQFFCNARILYNRMNHQRIHFIVYIYRLHENYANCKIMLAFYSIFHGKGKKICFHCTLNDRKYLHLHICLNHCFIKRKCLTLSTFYNVYSGMLGFFLSFTFSHMNYNIIYFLIT